MKIDTLKNTALHIAVESRRGDIVGKLVEQITKSTKKNPVDVLSIKNESGNDPLHLAASLGNIGMCECITGEYKQLLGKRNKKSETPLFLAVRHGKKDVFLWLYKEFENDTAAHECCGIESGGTVLHCAIEGGYFDLAFQIIQMDENPNLKGKHLMDYLDNGKSPLHLLAEKPTAFRSWIHLGLFKKIIYNCIFVEELIPETSHESPQHPKNHQTCINFFQKPWQMIKLPDQQSPSNFCSWLRSIKLIISKALLVIRLRIPGSSEIRKLKEKKEMHIRSCQIMERLLERAQSYQKPPEKSNIQVSQYIVHKATSKGCHSEHEYFRRGQGRSTPILIAASNGIVEMVEKTLQDIPVTIYDKDSTGKNIVLLAVENRQSHLYDFLLKSSHLRDNFGKDLALHAMDEHGNSALHLAAELKNYESWLIPSSSLLMHWEVKWYEYVKKSLRPNVPASPNESQKTPDQIFTEKHKKLLEKSKEWLNSTCNSCSFIAALIATVAFASSATVPGGVDQDTGKPIFQHHLAFRFFAISALVALCSSFISLLVFFDLLTSKCQYKDFSKNVPRNLFFGFTSLFISMAAMLICFISGHLLMLDNQLKYYAAVPVYAVTFLVITFISLQKFPSFLALVRAKFHNVPERIYKEDPLYGFHFSLCLSAKRTLCHGDGQT
ncbi:hypothetical protein PVL29_009416 [Vitis rotundifolia]|uniref:PGG domain-containing protein n=1 Tax=Vitis rotundifolia TaxID=103349 RepID=A0AA38ZYK4_VITRO|nr:hypothetical protein PVL29_009416 [Vitis rotundifolia]